VRIFVTGATGFIGSYLVPELLRADHQVAGLSRSPENAAKLAQAGAEAVPGALNDLSALRAGAASADAVIHAAFNHDFTRLKQHSEEDRRAVEALGEVLAGSGRPFIVTSGTGLVERKAGKGPVVETDPHASSAKVPRAATEEAADAVKAMGVRVIVVRLPQVHDRLHQGRIGEHIRLARETGRVVYIGLALERGQAGERFHAVDEEGVPMRDIAEVIGVTQNLPVESITSDESAAYFGPLAGLAGLDLAASSVLTRKRLGWTPTGPSLLTDLRQLPRQPTA
jgi:nucleoside-diphosphate-sugar epimerase